MTLFIKSSWSLWRYRCIGSIKKNNKKMQEGKIEMIIRCRRTKRKASLLSNRRGGKHLWIYIVGINSKFNISWKMWKRSTDSLWNENKGGLIEVILKEVCGLGMLLSPQALQVSQMDIGGLPDLSALDICKYFFQILTPYSCLCTGFCSSGITVHRWQFISYSQLLADLAVLAEKGFTHALQEPPGFLSAVMH